jgi:hypothetical protein
VERYPLPDLLIRVAISAGKISGTAMPIPACRYRAAMQGVSSVCFQANSDVLTIIVSKAAQDGPGNSGTIHCKPGMVELLSKVRIHAANHVILNRHSDPFGRGFVLPGKIAVCIPLRWGTLINAE